ncbi:CocE/NonD family hydrolase [Ornithinimicrobium sp. CNJ-824]|uniref:CocE/NonD family hydrolase n=1 Tax=Ornithinimicrobium sp. CNJ-824 TaxID=1904966 RepID=UPI0022A9D6D2|nr:CocE/NonD family hydrolase [Ornithinimicrobium sp. CNJ-824]
MARPGHLAGGHHHPDGAPRARQLCRRRGPGGRRTGSRRRRRLRHGARSDPAAPGPGPARQTAPRHRRRQRFYTWSRPMKHDTRITGTPRAAFEAAGTGNVLVRTWDVAPDGTAVMFDEQMSLVQDGTVEFDLKDTDWTLKTGHQLVVGIGTNTTRSWRDTPSGETITVSSPTLSLQLQNTRNDVPTHGDRAPYLDTYLRAYTGTMEDRMRGTFSLSVNQGRG